MRWFGQKSKSHKASDAKVPEQLDFPARAYVYRTAPEKVGRVQTAGRVPGDFDGFTTTHDLEDMVAKTCGGGTYRCKCNKSDDPKVHVGYHEFTIPGAPLMDGEPVAQPTGEETTGRGVPKIEKEIELEEAQTRLDEVKAKRKKRQEELGLAEGAMLDDDGTIVPSPISSDPVVIQLQAQLKHMEDMLVRKDREMDEERHRRELEGIESKFAQQIESLKSNSGGGVQAAQMEAIKAVITAGQQQTQAVLQSQSDLMKVMMSNDRSGGLSDRVDKLMDKLFDTKADASKNLLDMAKEGFNVGLMMAKGGEQTPASLTDVAREVSDRVLDIVGEFVRQRGEMGKDALAKHIQMATQKIVGQLSRQIAPGARLAVRGGVPAESAMPSPGIAALPPGSPQLSDADLRQRVDAVLKAFLYDIEHKSETWKAVVAQQIPPEEIAKIGALTFENISAYAAAHGSPELLQQVGFKLAGLGASTDEERAAVAQLDPNARASATVEAEEGIVDGAGTDESDDEEEIDDDAGQAPEDVAPPNPPRRSRRR